jgi:sterol desaturase/sphingolipid hydroxylase (fatty acid hydroxylase superfamily)
MHHGSLGDGRNDMLMRKLGYFAEFVVFPPFVIALAILAYDDADRFPAATWLLSVGAGALLWTLLEYLLHRFVFHHAPIISEIHEQHHHDPLALIGAPAWTSFVLALMGVLFPLWLLLGIAIAAGMTSGMICGYLWYVLVHYASHHWQPRPGSYLYRVRLRHARHHYSHDEGNFGVTVEFWDRVFRTELERRSHRILPRDAVS